MSSELQESIVCAGICIGAAAIALGFVIALIQALVPWGNRADTTVRVPFGEVVGQTGPLCFICGAAVVVLCVQAGSSPPRDAAPPSLVPPVDQTAITASEERYGSKGAEPSRSKPAQALPQEVADLEPATPTQPTEESANATSTMASVDAVSDLAMPTALAQAPMAATAEPNDHRAPMDTGQEGEPVAPKGTARTATAPQDEVGTSVNDMPAGTIEDVQPAPSARAIPPGANSVTPGASLDVGVDSTDDSEVTTAAARPKDPIDDAPIEPLLPVSAEEHPAVEERTQPAIDHQAPSDPAGIVQSQP